MVAKNEFLKLFGKSNSMKVFDLLLDYPIDVTVHDICEGADLSRNTVDEIMKDLVDRDIVQVTRIVGKTKLFRVNKQNRIAKKLIELNNLVLKSQEEKLSIKAISV